MTSNNPDFSGATRTALVYDLPTRIFHLLFSLLFLVVIIIAKLLGDDHPAFVWHMIAGIQLAFLVLLRIIWGIAGSRWARFSSFPLSISKVVSYFKSIISGEKSIYSGHNPASAWAGLLMMVCVAVLAFTGYQMTNGKAPEAFEEIHKMAANLFLFLVVTHLAGLFLHSARHNDRIAMSMVHGQKSVPAIEGISGARPFAGLVFFVLIAAGMLYSVSQFDKNANTLSLFGNTFQLTGSEEESSTSEQNGDEKNSQGAPKADHDEDDEDEKD